MAGIFNTPSREDVTHALKRRAQARMDAQSDEALATSLAEAVYLERRRFASGDLPGPGEGEAIEAAAAALHRDRPAVEAAALALVDLYTCEIYNRFSPRTYRFATRILPGALTRLFTATRPQDLLGADFDPASRIRVGGPLETLRRLAQTHTLIMAPTHVSNMDSPLLGYALYAAGLPPVVYGAGLNLFSNPAMAFFMSRLGAYTVDRRKRHAIYKDVLKDYSIEAISRGCHSLFFPGGTRSRSGRIETKLKKGLLGTGLSAWQEGLEQGRPNPEVLVVPCVLSSSLVLEAESLIEESLKEEGRQRYIISDDEFANTRRVASFLRRVLTLDASVYVHFSNPLDVFGNRVDEEGASLDSHGAPLDRRGYIEDRDGEVRRDGQRDRVYTQHLANALERSYLADSTALPTHVTAFAAWNLLRAGHRRSDLYQVALLRPPECILPAQALLASIERLVQRLDALTAEGRIRQALPAGGASAVLELALGRFATFHKRRAVAMADEGIVAVDPKLALYYANRLVGYDLERIAQGAEVNP